MADKIVGIDVHKKVLMVVVMDAFTPGSKPERQRFATMRSEFASLIDRDSGFSSFVAQRWRDSGFE